MSTPTQLFTCPQCGGNTFDITRNVTCWETLTVSGVSRNQQGLPCEYDLQNEELGDTTDAGDFYDAECCWCGQTLDDHPLLPGRDGRDREEAQRRHRAQGGSRCPYCDADEVEGESIEVIGQRAYQEMGCLACDKSWTAVYELLGFMRPESAVQDLEDMQRSRARS